MKFNKTEDSGGKKRARFKKKYSMWYDTELVRKDLKLIDSH